MLIRFSTVYAMKPVVDLLVSLRRHELTARNAIGQMSPNEKSALDVQLALVRDTVPQFVLGHYDRLKRTRRGIEACPVVLAMATLVDTYRDLPPGKRRTLSSFFDLAGYSPRR